MIYDPYAGRLAELDGQTVTIAAFTAAYVPSQSDATLDAIDADEVSTGDAAGYERQTVGATWDAETRRLTFDDPAVFDLDGAEVQHFVVADNTGALAFPLSYDTPFNGYDGFELHPPVAASEADTAGIEARLLALETAPGPASPVPDPSEAPDGQVIVTFDGEYILDDGGVASVVAGTGITVDDTDPANPIISATGGGGGGGAYDTTPEVNTVGDEEDGALWIDASDIDPSVRSVAYLIADTVTSISVQMPSHETRGRLALAFYAANPVTVTVSLGEGPDASFTSTNLMTIDADYVAIAGGAMWLPFGTWSL